MFRRILILAALALLLIGALQAQQPSFLSYVAVGDSLTAGYISGSLNEDGQRAAYPVLLSAQMRTFVFVPLVARPGIPNELQLISAGFPPNLQPRPGTSTGRIFPLLMATNLGVPGHTADAALRKRPVGPVGSAAFFNPDNILTNLILGLPGLVAPIAPAGSQVEQAEFLKPTFATIWLGNNEALGPASAGSANLPSLESFRDNITEVINRVLATGARIAVANVADVPSAAFFFTIPELAAAAGVPAPLVQFVLGVGPEDLIPATAIPTLLQIAQGQAQGPLPPNLVLTAQEVRAIRERTQQYNNVIARLAEQRGFPVVDSNALLRRIRREGVAVGNLRLTGSFLGGIFSLDLIHPTRTGQAIVANEFIAAINSFYKTTLVPVDVAAIAAADNLVFRTKQGDDDHLTWQDLEEIGTLFSEESWTAIRQSLGWE
ncbi:MAG TPA: SGNH/GDSL hydrolase family protein [Acidobacteriota bacterium]